MSADARDFQSNAEAGGYCQEVWREDPGNHQAHQCTSYPAPPFAAATGCFELSNSTIGSIEETNTTGTGTFPLLIEFTRQKTQLATLQKEISKLPKWPHFATLERVTEHILHATVASVMTEVGLDARQSYENKVKQMVRIEWPLSNSSSLKMSTMHNWQRSTRREKNSPIK